MPELPEVETIRRGLAAQIVGRQITEINVRQPRLRELVDANALHTQVVGCTIDAVDRRAKYILIHLRPGHLVLVLHLGMSGRLRVGPPAAADARHDHLIFRLGSDMALRFNDPRRFGMCFLTRVETLSEHPRFRHLGPEPLSDDFTVAYLQTRAHQRRAPVKNFLMDAAVVVGVGNIYASESLFLARIRPTREVGRLRRLHWQRIHASVQHVLREAIEHHGTTLSDYVDSEGRQGAFQNRLLVYGREGERCCRDGRRIRRLVQAGRSSFFCPGCQR